MNTKLRLWTSLRDWDSVTGQWYRTAIQDINAEELEAQVQYFMKTAIQVCAAALCALCCS